MEVVKYYIIYIVVISGLIAAAVASWDKILDFFKKIFSKKEPDMFIPTCPKCLIKMKFVSQERFFPEFPNMSDLLNDHDNMKRKRIYICKKCDIREPVIYTCKSI